MTNAEYITEAKKTDSPNTHLTIFDALEEQGMADIIHAIIGISTEAGELQDALKKHLIYGKPLDRTNIIEEVGDLFWYIALLAGTLKFTFDEAQEKNIAKLKLRYPNKFVAFDALNRNLERERSALELDPGVPELKPQTIKS